MRLESSLIYFSFIANRLVYQCRQETSVQKVAQYGDMFRLGLTDTHSDKTARDRAVLVASTSIYAAMANLVHV